MQGCRASEGHLLFNCFTCNQDLVGVFQDFACIIRKAAPKIFLFHNVSKDTLNPELCLFPEYPRRFVLLRTPECPPRSKQTLPGMEPGAGGVSWRLRDPTQPYSKQWLTPHVTYYTPPTLSQHLSTHLTFQPFKPAKHKAQPKNQYNNPETKQPTKTNTIIQNTTQNPKRLNRT